MKIQTTRTNLNGKFKGFLLILFSIILWFIIAGIGYLKMADLLIIPLIVGIILLLKKSGFYNIEITENAIIFPKNYLGSKSTHIQLSKIKRIDFRHETVKNAHMDQHTGIRSDQYVQMIKIQTETKTFSFENDIAKGYHNKFRSHLIKSSKTHSFKISLR